MSRLKMVVGVVGLALALPAASWAHAQPSVAAVQTHVRASDKAFDAAVAQARKSKDVKAQRFFQAGRAQLAQAQADTAKLVRGADSGQERAVAAQAVELMADEREEWIAGLPELLAEVEGGFEAKAAAALLADAKGRDAALETLVTMLEQGVPEQAQPRVARAAAELAGEREDEIAAILELLNGDEVGKPAKARLLACLEAIVDGQAEAAEQLAGAADEVSAQTAAILAQAYEQIADEQQTVAKAITAAGNKPGGGYRSAFEQLAQQAQQTSERLETTDYPQPGPGQEGGEQSGSGSSEGTGSDGGQNGYGSGEGTGSDGSAAPEPSQPEQGSQPDEQLAGGNSGSTP